MDSSTVRALGGGQYLATPAIATGNGGALAWGGRLVVMLVLLVLLLDIVLRRRRALLAVGVLGRWTTRPLIGARQAVLLGVRRMLVMGHVRTRFLGGRRKRWVHLGLGKRKALCQQVVLVVQG